MKVIDLDTETGNQLLETLMSEGWKKVKEYPPLAFDKGIDFDSFTLRKDGLELVLEWTNWLEWEIRGDDAALEALADRYGFKVRFEGETGDGS
ncbi:hypothetical protein B5T_00727 [Alloalcanivorax dieselolei B5]|uniref:Uncharacterized protein n=1 Tax=Alcanivorax dieselolei (strain DSM 16502 / CGMCC 1.3690 / MCCC 1A00001 / B-5) TaxID=930169 RepID=K0CBY1_ALCDB|nr:hypothetical protein [Alloalcanivorax dieselolei]AFT69011.1 hypothetical protein B5T_00727 [Alloalcanivorax dieselolei B5]GGJ81857.1 hypothetical protein GCM10007426_08630 [Alloalcanivorax dieselolei]